MAKRKVRASIPASRTRSGVLYFKQEVMSDSECVGSKLLRHKRGSSPQPAVQKKRSKLEPRSDSAVDQREDKPQPHDIAPASNSPPLTAAAEREEKLRADLRADVRGPHLVTCRMCGNDVKLSNKTLYDGSHWRTHAKRCERSRNVKDARESESNPGDSSIIKEEPVNGPDSSKSPRIRVVSGSSPLKLRFVFSKSLQKVPVPLETHRGYGDSQRASPEPSFSNSEAQGRRQDRRSERALASPLTCTSSQIISESNDSEDSVLTPEPDDVPEVFVVSSSFVSDSDEIREETEVMEMMEVDGKWTDGEYTTSPLDVSFSSTQIDDTTLSERDTDIDSGGDSASVDNMDVEIETSVENMQSTTTPKLHQDDPPPDITISSTACISESTPTFSSRTPTAALSSQETEPEIDDSDLEFEYPDWEPPALPDAYDYERKLRAQGICLENIIRSWNVTFNDTGSDTDAHNLRPMVTA